MNPQSNTQAGAIVIASGEDLSTKAGYLVEIRNNSGVAQAYLPDSINDYAFYQVIDGGSASGDNVTLLPLHQSRNFRVVLKGAINPGEILSLADPTTTADKGKLRKVPSAAGTYRVLAIAEEAGVDGQAVLVRHVPIGQVTM